MQNEVQAVLILATKVEFTERAPQSDHQHLSSWRTRAVVSTGLHGRWATGLTEAEREENFTRTESVATLSREGRAAYEAEISSALRFCFFDRCNVFQSGGKKLHERGRGFLFFLNFFVSFFIVFTVLPRAVLSLSHISKEENMYPTWGTACGVRVVFLDGAWSSRHL